MLKQHGVNQCGLLKDKKLEVPLGYVTEAELGKCSPVERVTSGCYGNSRAQVIAFIYFFYVDNLYYFLMVEM